MLEDYWAAVVDIKVAAYYYQFYAVSASRRKRVVSGLCTLASSAFVISWIGVGKLSLLWAALIMLAQIVSVIQPCFPYEKQYHAACYIYEDVTQLSLKAEGDFRGLAARSNTEEIESCTRALKDAYEQIETRFADADTFPQRRCLHKKAEKEAEIYFRRYQT